MSIFFQVLRDWDMAYRVLSRPCSFYKMNVILLNKISAIMK